MASNTVDALIFGATKFRDASEEAWAKVPSFLPLVSYERAPQGVKTIEVPVLGGFTAYDLSLNVNTAIEAQPNTDSKVVVNLDTYAAFQKIVDVGVEYQQAVDQMAADAMRIRQAHNAKINAKILATLRASTPITTCAGNTTAAPATTPAEIAAAIEKAVTDAQVAFDETWGVDNSWTKNIWLPAKLFRNLAMGTTKQTRDNSVDDNGIRIVEGIPGTFQGATPYNVGTINKVYDASTDTTRFEFWVATPSAVMAAVQLEEMGQSVPIAGTMLKSTTISTLYGYKAGPANQTVKCYVYLDGNV